FDFHRPSQTLFLVERWRERITSELQDEWIRSRLAGSGISFLGVEDRTFGTVIIQTLTAKGGITVWPLKADRDKVARSITYSDMVKRKKFFLPSAAPWVSSWISEHAPFPNGAHDDQVDCGSYAGLATLNLPRHATPGAERAEIPVHEKRFYDHRGRRRDSDSASAIRRKRSVTRGILGW